MRAFLIVSATLLAMSPALADSVLTLPVSQDTPSVIALGVRAGTMASVVGTLGEPATDDSMVSSIGEAHMRYEAPVVIRGGLDAGQPAQAAVPQPTAQQVPGYPPQTTRSAPMSSGQAERRAREQAERAAQQQVQQSAAPSGPVATVPVTPGIVRPE